MAFQSGDNGGRSTEERAVAGAFSQYSLLRNVIRTTCRFLI